MKWDQIQKLPDDERIKAISGASASTESHVKIKLGAPTCLMMRIHERPSLLKPELNHTHRVYMHEFVVFKKSWLEVA